MPGKSLHILWTGLVLALLVLGGGCVTEKQPDEKEMTEEEKVDSEIKFLVDAMAVPEIGRIDQICNKLVAHGEKAIPELVRNIDNRIPMIRMGSIFSLGAIYQKTKSPDILRLKPQFQVRLNDSFLPIRLEAASALCTMGDYQGVPLLISMLTNEEPFVRMTAEQSLRKVFGLPEGQFGYYHYDTRLFNIDFSYMEDLNHGHVTTALRTEFQQRKYNLPAAVKISVIRPDRIWAVVNDAGESIFSITRAGKNTLSVNRDESGLRDRAKLAWTTWWQKNKSNYGMAHQGSK